MVGVSLPCIVLRFITPTLNYTAELNIQTGIVFLFNTVIYVFLFLCLCILILCLCISIVPAGTLRLP